MNDTMTRPPHWLDRHGHGDRGWPEGWVVDRYTVQLPVVEIAADSASPAGDLTVGDTSRPECEQAQRESDRPGRPQ